MSDTRLHRFMNQSEVQNLPCFRKISLHARGRTRTDSAIEDCFAEDKKLAGTIPPGVSQKSSGQSFSLLFFVLYFDFQ